MVSPMTLSISTSVEAAIALLHRNLTPAGVLAASASPRAAKRNYTRIFGRDHAICALGMAVSGDVKLCLLYRSIKSLTLNNCPVSNGKSKYISERTG
jgi:hypothetical protein